MKEEEINSGETPISPERKENTILQEPSTDKESNMEIHHHSSHTSNKGGWKSYTKEFLMLFLAVFCGSLAEYWLEHKIEREKEKEFIASMIEDLKADTLNLSKTICRFDTMQCQSDTVLMMFNKLGKGYNDTLFRNLFVLGYPDFVYTDRTIQQLKNSGGMRLIHNQEAANAIVEYDAKMRLLTETLDTDLHNILSQSLLPIWYEIVDSREYSYDLQTKSKKQILKENKTYLLKKDDVLLGKFFNCYMTYKAVSIALMNEEKQTKIMATKLLKKLSEEYDLE